MEKSETYERLILSRLLIDRDVARNMLLYANANELQYSLQLKQKLFHSPAFCKISLHLNLQSIPHSHLLLVFIVNYNCYNTKKTPPGGKFPNV